jgi:hypothetical protein
MASIRRSARAISKPADYTPSRQRAMIINEKIHD